MTRKNSTSWKKSIMSGLATLSVAGMAMMASAQTALADTDTPVCIRTWTGYWVTAVGGGNANVDASYAGGCGPNQIFTKITKEDGTVRFRAPNGTHFMRQDLNQQPNIASKGTVVNSKTNNENGAWTKMELSEDSDGLTTIQIPNGRYIYAERGGGGNVFAGDAVGLYSQFFIIDRSGDRPSMAIQGGTLLIHGSDWADRITLTDVTCTEGVAECAMFKQTRVEVSNAIGLYEDVTRQFEGVTAVTAWLQNGDDEFDGSDLDIPMDIRAGNGDDFIWGGSAADTLMGQTGNDSVFPWGGNDTVRCGSGNDTLKADYYYDRSSSSCETKTGETATDPSDALNPFSQLLQGEELTSLNGEWSVGIGSDGWGVIRFGPNGHADYVAMAPTTINSLKNHEGVLRLKLSNGSYEYFPSTGTSGVWGQLVLHDDGTLDMHHADGHMLWSIGAP